MKKLFYLALCLAIVTTMFAQKKNATNTTDSNMKFKTLNDSISYTLGADFGKNISGFGLEVNLDFFMRGAKDFFEKKELAFSEEETAQVLNKLQSIIAEKQQKAAKEQIEKIKQEGEAFLAENKKNKDIITTASGLQYKILTKGNGKIPTIQDTVVAHYTGSLTDGTVFQSSLEAGEPISFPVTGVIKGWAEALQMMPVGSRWVLYIPSDLAYGDQGAGQVIPPGAALIFEVELISIKKN
jgi:FKBP-type peptidyl-prolyl cis-trans isomerase FklB